MGELHDFDYFCSLASDRTPLVQQVAQNIGVVAALPVYVPDGDLDDLEQIVPVLRKRSEHVPYVEKARFARKCKESKKLADELVETKEEKKSQDTMIAVASALEPSLRTSGVAARLNPLQVAVLDQHLACKPKVQGRGNELSRVNQNKATHKTSVFAFAVQSKD